MRRSPYTLAAFPASATAIDVPSIRAHLPVPARGPRHNPDGAVCVGGLCWRPPLQTEGFENLLAAPVGPFDFGAFTLSSSSSLTVFGANNLVRTEGVKGLGISGNGTVTLAFDNPINAFAIDWSSLEGTETIIGYGDNVGGSRPDVFAPMVRAGAGFLGVRNSVGFTTMTFALTSNEILEFDNVQWGATQVPEPAAAALFGVGVLGLVAVRRRRRSA